jgi:long-chain acyl-CoA synthetase
MSHACATIGIPVATAYDTLGESGLTHSLNEPNCVGVFTNAELLSTLKNVLPNTPSVRFIVYDGVAKPSLLDDVRNIRESVGIVSIDELHNIGAEQSSDGLKYRRPSKDDVALIMYTSGSTGSPKGVVLTHGNVIASVGAIYQFLGHHISKDDTFLAYLPLAHILEYIVELIVFFIGMKTGYGRVKTLIDSSVRQCKGDLVTFRPTFMVGVPAVWEQIRKGIVSKVDASGFLRKSIFYGAMAAKKANVPGLRQLADAVVFDNIKQATGGQLRLAVSGGAALSKETQEVLSVALVTMLQGE